MARRGSGGVAVWFDMTPDPMVYSTRLVGIANEVRDTTIPLMAAKEQMQADIRERFITETDPDGQPWADWAPSYEPVALSYPNIGILRRTEELYEAATDDAAFTISNDTLYHEAEGLPDYAMYHRTGTSKMPAREFLGVSRVAEGMIYGIFGNWFDRIIDLYWTERGRIGARHSLRGGDPANVGRFSPNP